jgi:hypothetical protein
MLLSDFDEFYFYPDFISHLYFLPKLHDFKNVIVNTMARVFTLYPDEAQLWLLNSPRRVRRNFLTNQLLGSPNVPSKMAEKENRSEYGPSRGHMPYSKCSVEKELISPSFFVMESSPSHASLGRAANEHQEAVVIQEM